MDWPELGKSSLLIVGLAIAVAALTGAHFWSVRWRVRLSTLHGVLLA